MNELYCAQILLQSKNVMLFNKNEKQRLGNLLSETPHFKMALCSESKHNMVKLYKHVVIKVFNKRNLIYHMAEPDNHLYLIVKGKVACFVPSSQAKILGQIGYNSEQWKKKLIDSNKFNRDNMNKNKEDDFLLNEFASSQTYFENSTCLFSKIKTLNSGEAFGGNTPYHLATFIAEEETTLLIIPFKKYEKFFAIEVIRFQHVNSGLADLFCRNEQNILDLIQEEDQRNLKEQGVTSNTNKSNIKLLDMICSDFLQNASIQQEFKENNSKNEEVSQTNSKKERNSSSLIMGSARDIKYSKQKFISSQIYESVKFSFEDKKKALEKLLRSSELSYFFEVQKFEEPTCIYNEGDTAECYYLIETGKLSLSKVGIDSTLISYSEGDFIGFEDDGPKRLFSCHCEKETTVYQIQKRSFENNLHCLLVPCFKNLVKFTKKSLLSQYKEQRESGLIRGTNRRSSQFNLKDLQSNQQVSQLLQMINNADQNHKSYSLNKTPLTSSRGRNSRLSLLHFPQSNSSQKREVKFQECPDRSTLNKNRNSVLYNNVNNTGIFNKTQLNLLHSQSHNVSPTNNSLLKSSKIMHMGESFNFQQAHKIVLSQMKKVTQLKEDEKKKKNQGSSQERNVELSFIKYDPINNNCSNIFKEDTSFKKYPNSSYILSPQKQKSHINSLQPSIFKQQSPQMPTKQQIINQQGENQPYFLSTASLNRASSVPKLKKYSFSEYVKLNTFSNIYHKKKHIIAIAHLNEIQKDPIENNNNNNNKVNNSEKKVSTIDAENEKKNVTMLEKQKQKIISQKEQASDDIEQLNLENSAWIFETAQRHKDLDIFQIKSDIERQILSIPKIFQDKLWGPHAYRSALLNNKYVPHK